MEVLWTEGPPAESELYLESLGSRGEQQTDQNRNLCFWQHGRITARPAEA